VLQVPADADDSFRRAEALKIADQHAAVAELNRVVGGGFHLIAHTASAGISNPATLKKIYNTKRSLSIGKLVSVNANDLWQRGMKGGHSGLHLFRPGSPSTSP